MSDLSILSFVALVGWGTLVGLDLVSVAQTMIARPLVAGTVAGAILGDPSAGMRVGVLLELYALDVLPVGASRYPDFGPATIAATAAVAGAPWELSLGLGGTLGLIMAVLGGATLQILRRHNADDIQRRAAALAAGDSGAIRHLQRAGLARDAFRSAMLTIVGLLGATVLVRYVHIDRSTAVALTLTLVGAGLAAALSGAVRSAGRGNRLRALAAAIVVGIVLAVFV
jgi:mannose/fructose/N-acetylgalactosamine-specific phosphotransferase system component IIC